MEAAIQRLKASAAQEKSKREEAVAAKTGAEAAFQQKIDGLTQDIIAEQKKYSEKLQRAPAAAPERPATTATDGAAFAP